MSNPILLYHLENVEEEIKSFIVEYFRQLTDHKLVFKKEKLVLIELNKENVNYISDPSPLIEYIDEHKFIYPRKSEKIIECLKNKTLEFNILIDILRFLYFTYNSIKDNNNEKIKNDYLLNLIDSISQELKNTRGLIIYHDDLLTDELIQRFFENVYFLFKSLKFPSHDKGDISDYLRKEIPLAVRSSMKINLSNENAFKFDCSDNILNEEGQKRKQQNNINFPINLNKNEFDYIFNQKKIEKLIDFKIDILKNEKEIKREDDMLSVTVKDPKRKIDLLNKELNNTQMIKEQQLGSEKEHNETKDEVIIHFEDSAFYNNLPQDDIY